MTTSEIVFVVKQVLVEALQLEGSARILKTSTRLMGSLPELDSMSVVAVITALEERFDCTFEDDEISSDIFITVGSLAEFLEKKLATRRSLSSGARSYYAELIS